VDSSEELKQEPVTQNENRRDGNQKYKNKRENTFAGKEKEIGSHDPGNSAARAQSRQGRTPIEKRVQKPSADAAGQIESEIRRVAEVVLDVIAEDPEKEHIPGEMEEA